MGLESYLIFFKDLINLKKNKGFSYLSNWNQTSGPIRLLSLAGILSFKGLQGVKYLMAITLIG